MGPCTVEGGAMPAVPTAQLPLDLDLGRQTRELHRYFVRLETGLGVVPVELDRSGGRIVFGWMDQPIPSWQPYERQDELLAALGVEGSLLPVEAYANGPLHVYVELDSQAAVAGLHPDFAALGKLEGIGINCFAGSGSRW